MADSEQDEIENALNTIASSTERSTNMKKELKQMIYTTVSTLRKLFVKLKEGMDSKARMIIELQTLVATTKEELAVARDNTTKALTLPSSKEVAIAAGCVLAPSGPEASKQHKAITDQGMLFSEVIRGRIKYKHHELIMTSKESSNADTIKDILISNINSTAIKVGISSIKTLRNSRVQIEAGNKEDIDRLRTSMKRLGTNYKLMCRNCETPGWLYKTSQRT